jgi:lipopolysaccharide transport system ATP-binding protein
VTTVVAEGLSKRYKIGEYKAGYETLRDTLSHGVRRALRLEHVDHSGEEIWALKDVSFTIKEGEVVGFIGRNGAGKSTLLKVLTQITPPTEGMASIRGRVGSILEVGTGFHPELTGRENTYLNGAILGMKRREIRTKFDEIVEFSGIGKFIDTPVKRYSSGMYVRLAFAVAAHLDPEVLIIDEVLAVGDYEFQQRCMGRIEDISGSGRTVIFVSHDMQAITRLCNRAYWLHDGQVMAEGPSEEVVSRYLQEASGAGAEVVFEPGEAPGSPFVRLHSARVVDTTGETVHTVDVRDRVGIEMQFSILDEIGPLFPKIKLGNDRGEVVFNAFDTDHRWRTPPEPGTYTCTAWIPDNLLNEGVIAVDVTIASLGAPTLVNHVNVPAVIRFHVVDPGLGDSAKGLFTGQLRGGVRPLLDWTTEYADARGYETAKRTTGSLVSSDES